MTSTWRKRCGVGAWVLLALLATAHRGLTAPLPVADVKRDKPVDFETEVLPILARSCLACHNAKDAESDLVLETPQTILKGGALGPAAVAGKSGESLLFKAARHADDPVMPPAGNKVGAKNLTPEELGLVKLWIDQGAKGEVKGGGPVQWQPLPPGVNPIYAAAMSPDGQVIACGRANQIFLYQVGSGRSLGRLTDPALVSSGVTKQPGVAHLDLVQSLAFSPDGELLASGGFREVKLWQRPRNIRARELTLADAARTVAVSSDGKWLAVGETSGKIELVDLAAGKVTKTLSGHSAAVTGVAFATDNPAAADARLVSTSEDKTLRMWNLADGKEIYAVETPTPITALVLVDGRSQGALGSPDNTIRVYDLPATKPAAPLKPVKELKGHSGPITSLATAVVDGKPQLLSGSRDGTMRLWAAADGRQLNNYSLGGPVLAVAATPDGKRLAGATEAKTIKFINPQSGQTAAEVRGDMRAHRAVDRATREVNLAKSRLTDRQQAVPQAEQLAKSEADNVTRTTTAKTAADKALTEKMEALKKPTADKQAADKAVAEAQQALEKAKAEIPLVEQRVKDATAAVEKTKAAKTAADKAALAKDAPPKAKDDQKAADKALADANKSLNDTQQAKNKAAQQPQAEQTKLTQAEQKAKQASEAFKKAENDVQTAQSSVTAAVKAVETAQATAKKATDAVPVAKAAVQAAETVVKEAEAKQKSAQQAATDAEKPFRQLAFAADGQVLYAGSESGLVQAWSAEGLPADLFVGLDKPAAAVVPLPDGQLASVAEKSLVVWNTAAEWKLVRTLGHVDDATKLVDRVISLSFSPDGKLLATGSGQPSRSGQLKLWNVADGQLVREFVEPHSDTIFSVRFSPDGQHVASAAADRFVKTFETATGKLARSFEGHTHHVLGVAWRADGKLLASGGADNAIKIWDHATGEQRRTITNYAKEVTSITFLGDSEQIISCSGDAVTRVHGANDGGNRRNYPTAGDFLYVVATSEDGKLVATGGQDGILRIWANSTDLATPLHTLAPPDQGK